MSFKAFLQEKSLNKGAFHRWLGKSEDEPITAADIAKGKAAGGHPEKMAIQAQNFREETVQETLSKDATASDYVDDFVHSKNKMFKGDSKKQKIKRALGAYYAKNESIDEAHSKIEKVQAREILDKHEARGTDFHTLRMHQVQGLLDSAKEHGYKKNKYGSGSTARMFHAHLHRIVGEEVVSEASPVTGTRIISKHGVGSPHHAEVRFNKDYDEYSVHHYKHGKHMGEGPVSYHSNDKEDAKNTAEHEVKRHNAVAEAVVNEGRYNVGDTVHWRGMTGDTLAGVVHKVHQNNNEPMYHVKRHLDGHSAHKFHSELIHKVREEVLDEVAKPLKGHHYHLKSDAELHHIAKDAGAAAQAMKGHSPHSEAKYLDQMNDAHTVLHYRSKGGKRHVEKPFRDAAVTGNPRDFAREEIEMDEAVKYKSLSVHTIAPFTHQIRGVTHDGEERIVHHGLSKFETSRKVASLKKKHGIAEEVAVNEKITDSKESLEKAIAAAERKAARSQTRENSSYIEALKKALRRIKGRKNIKAAEIGQKAVAEDTTSAPSEPGTVKRAARIKFKKKTNESTEMVTELSKKVLSSYRTKAIAQIKAGKGELKGKEEKRFNGAAKSIKEEKKPTHYQVSHTYRNATGSIADRISHTEKTHGIHNLRVDSRHQVRHFRHNGEDEVSEPRRPSMTDLQDSFVSDAELDALYEADQAFHNQDEFTKHAHASGHIVRTILRGSNAHIHAKHMGSGKTHGLFDVKKEHGVYSTSPLHVEEQFDGDEMILVMEDSHMSDVAHELVLHADNHAQLHHSSHQPIIKNLKKKAKSGKYDSEKAKKLWGYHADRAAQTYHKEHGDKHSKWHHMFSTSDRKQAAAHWEAHHRHEVHQ